MFRIQRNFLHIFRQSNSKKTAKKTTLSKDSQLKSINLKGNIALVTGGAEGIGLAVTRLFLKCGASGIVIADFNKEKGCEAIEKLGHEFGDSRVLFLDCDTSESKQLDSVFKETIEHFEGLDIIVNNAGVMNDVAWENQISTNLNSTVIGTLLGMQYMSKTSVGQGGTIINIASIMGLIPSAGYPLHTLTQFGIVGFTRAVGGINHFERTGVRIAALCPGLTNTKMMKQAVYQTINENFRNEFKEESGGCPLQKPESVALAILDVLKEGLSGSVWVVENDSKPYEIQFPEVADLRFKNKC